MSQGSRLSSSVRMPISVSRWYSPTVKRGNPASVPRRGRLAACGVMHSSLILAGGDGILHPVKVAIPPRFNGAGEAGISPGVGLLKHDRGDVDVAVPLEQVLDVSEYRPGHLLVVVEGDQVAEVAEAKVGIPEEPQGDVKLAMEAG